MFVTEGAVMKNPMHDMMMHDDGMMMVFNASNAIPDSIPMTIECISLVNSTFAHQVTLLSNSKYNCKPHSAKTIWRNIIKLCVLTQHIM
jgi:hypothetical protein